MNSILQWCNENQGFIAILVVLVPMMLGLVPKCVKHIQQKREKKKNDAHNADLKAVVDYMKSHFVTTPKILADVLNKSEEDIKKLLSELIDQGIVKAVADNCELSDSNSVWQLRQR